MACFIFRLLHSIRIVRNKSTEKKEWLHHSINIQLNVQVFSKEIIFIDAIVVIAYSIVFLPIFNSHVPFFPFHKPINIFFPTLFYSMKWKKGKKSKYFPKKVSYHECGIHKNMATTRYKYLYKINDPWKQMIKVRGMRWN